MTTTTKPPAGCRVSPRICACGCGVTFTPKRPEQICIDRKHSAVMNNVKGRKCGKHTQTRVGKRGPAWSSPHAFGDAA